MYLCVFASFYDFWVGFWNCSENIVCLFVMSFIFLRHHWRKGSSEAHITKRRVVGHNKYLL
jgi:hypothetical protein